MLPWGDGMLERVGSWLGSSRMPLVCGLVAVLLSIPSVDSGLQTDDHLLLHALDFDTPRFALWRVTPERFARLQARGSFAWWSGPDVDVSFLRPLGELSHRLDRVLFGDDPVPMHLENVLLYGLIAWLAALVFRELLPARLAGLAALIFVLNDAHGHSVGWISGRNTLLAALFGLAAVLTLVRAPRAFGARLLSALLLALSLASGEAGTATLAYLAAYALVLSEGSPGERLRALWMHVAVALTWLVTYVGGDYGARGVGAYRDFAAAPLQTLAHGLLDLPAWLFSQLGVSMVGALLAAPDVPARVLPAVLVLPLLVLVLPVLREDRRSHFFALAFGLALLPLFTTVPQDRTLLGASLAGCGLAACALGRFSHSASRLRRGGLVVLAALHLMLSPLLFPMALTSMSRLTAGAHALVAALPDAPGRNVILVNSPVELMSLFGVSIALRAGGPEPASLHQLHAGHSALTVARIDDRTLELTATPGYANRRIERLFTSPGWAARAGEARRVGPLRVTVREVDAHGWPTRVRFAFGEALESKRYAWRVWQGQRVEPWMPPAVGQRVELPGLSLATALPRPERPD